MSREQRLNGDNSRRFQKAWDDMESLHATMEALEEENERLWEQKKAYEEHLMKEQDWHDARVRALPDGPEMREHDAHARAIRGLVNSFNPKYNPLVEATVKALRPLTKKFLFQPTTGDTLKQFEEDAHRAITSLMSAENQQKNIEVTIEPDPAIPGRATMIFTGLTPRGNEFLQRMKDKMEAEKA